MYQFPVAAVINYHEQQNFLTVLEERVQNRGVDKFTPPPKALKQNPLHAFLPAFRGCQAVFGTPRLVNSSLQFAPPIFPSSSMFVTALPPSCKNNYHLI